MTAFLTSLVIVAIYLNRVSAPPIRTHRTGRLLSWTAIQRGPSSNFKNER